MRLVMISHGFVPRVGGIESLLAALTPVLKQRNLDVIVLTRRLPGTKRYEEMNGVPIYRLPAPGPKPIASLLFTLSVLFRIRQLSPDIIHAHEFISPATAAVVSRMLFRIPFVLTPHLSGPTGDVQKLLSKKLGVFRMNLIRKYAAFFHVISEEINQELGSIGIPAEKRVFIHNGVDTNRFSPADETAKRHLRVKLGLAEGGPVFLFAGRLVPMKRPDLLLRVWPEIHAAHSEAELVVIGEGPMAAEIVAADLPNLHFMGSQRDVVPFIQAADVLLMPSDSEGLPMLLLESMACGVPAIAARVGGIPQVLTDGVNGRLIPADDAGALRENILNVMQDREGCQSMGRQAAALIREHYSINSVADQLLKVYKTVHEMGGL